MGLYNPQLQQFQNWICVTVCFVKLNFYFLIRKRFSCVKVLFWFTRQTTPYNLENNPLSGAASRLHAHLYVYVYVHACYTASKENQNELASQILSLSKLLDVFVATMSIKIDGPFVIQSYFAEMSLATQKILALWFEVLFHLQACQVFDLLTRFTYIS